MSIVSLSLRLPSLLCILLLMGGCSDWLSGRQRPALPSLAVDARSDALQIRHSIAQSEDATDRTTDTLAVPETALLAAAKPGPQAGSPDAGSPEADSPEADSPEADSHRPSAAVPLAGKPAHAKPAPRGTPVPLRGEAALQPEPSRSAKADTASGRNAMAAQAAGDAAGDAADDIADAAADDTADNAARRRQLHQPRAAQTRSQAGSAQARHQARSQAQSEALTPDGLEAVHSAVRQEPRRRSFVNAIQVYPYSEGALYRLYARPGQVSDIMLEPGEQLIALVAGDTLRWLVGNTVSGQGAGARVHVLVKPMADELQTNLVITTDRRAYYVDLQSRARGFMAALAWHYPQDLMPQNLMQQASMLQTSTAQTRGRAAGLSARPAVAAPDRNHPVDLQQLRFGYAISGDRPAWRPDLVFDDGQKVYIRFPAGIAQTDAPPLFVIGEDGRPALVNYRMQGRYYIVDQLFARAELRLGMAPQQVVQLTQPATTAQAMSAGARARPEHVPFQGFIQP